MCHYCTETSLIRELAACLDGNHLPPSNWRDLNDRKYFYAQGLEDCYKEARETLLGSFDSTNVSFFHFYAQESSLQELTCFISRLSEEEHTYLAEYSEHSEKIQEIHPLFEPRSPYMLFEILAYKTIESIMLGNGESEHEVLLYKHYPYLKSCAFPLFSNVASSIYMRPHNNQFVQHKGIISDNTLLDSPVPIRSRTQADAIVEILQPFAFLYELPDSFHLRKHQMQEECLIKGLQLFLEGCIEKPGDNNFVGALDEGYGRSGKFDSIGALPYFDMETFERLLRVAEYCVQFVPWNETSREILLEMALGSSSMVHLREMGLWLSRRAAVRIFQQERYTPLLQMLPELIRPNVFRYLMLKCGVNEEELAAIRQYYTDPNFCLIDRW